MLARPGAIALAALLAPACGGSGILPQGSVATGGGASALAFADVGPAVPGVTAPPDVLVASPKRGELDVLAENADGSWREVGSFYAGGAPQELAVGHVGGRGAVAVRDQGGSVALLAADPGMPHRLTFPVQIYRRVRNGRPVDDSPPSTAIALADFDGDGSDELVAATPNGVLVIVGLDRFAGANPEHPPPANGFRLDAGPSPGAVAAVDVDGDGRLDLLALDASHPIVRLYHHGAGGAGDFDPARAIDLPSPGVAVVASGCAGAPARVLLDGGQLVALGRDGRVVPWLNAGARVASLLATRDALAVARAQGLTVYDACARFSFGLDLPSHAGLAMTREKLALLGSDGATVSLYRLITGF